MIYYEATKKKDRTIKYDLSFDENDYLIILRNGKKVIKMECSYLFDFMLDEFPLSTTSPPVSRRRASLDKLKYEE